jgi:hypothetical protein
MLAFTFNRGKQSRNRPARRECAERRLDLAVDRRPTVKKFEFQDIFRSVDQQAELAMMNPRPSAFRRFFAQFAQPRRVKTVEQRVEAGVASASGARLTMLL